MEENLTEETAFDEGDDFNGDAFDGEQEEDNKVSDLPLEGEGTNVSDEYDDTEVIYEDGVAEVVSLDDDKEDTVTTEDDEDS